MTALRPTRTVFSVSQFVDWQKAGTLVLQPVFQRREVWKQPARSQLIDSIARGYPLPIILLRQVQDLQTLSTRMEVVDGQQRLRAIINFVAPHVLPASERDPFTVSKMHNKELAGKRFLDLPDSQKHHFLSYELSSHVFPSSVGDQEIYRIFARLNSTGLNLNKQEIRNATYHGALKTLVYDLAFEYLDYWREWEIFNDTDISRMQEAELVSDLLYCMKYGLSGKEQAAIDKFYSDGEEKLAEEPSLRRRFEEVLASLVAKVDDQIATSPFSRPALFFSLFMAFYDHLYGDASPLRSSTRKKSLPRSVAEKFRRVSTRIDQGDLPDVVQDAIDKATSDKGRRTTRHKFLMGALGLESAS